MTAFRNFISKHSLIISIAILIIFVVLFFIPYVGGSGMWADIDDFENSAYMIVSNLHSCVSSNDVIYYPESDIRLYNSYIFAILFVYIVLWVTQIFAIFMAKKHPFTFIMSLIPFSVVFFGTIYMVDGWLEYSNIYPSAGIFIMAIVYGFLLFVLFSWLYPILKTRVQVCRRKPTKSERIAELEKQVKELQQVQHDEKET